MKLIKKFFSLKLITILSGILIIPPALTVLLSLTGIPVLSDGSLLEAMILPLSFLYLFLLAVAIVLYLVSRTRARAGILAAAVIGMVSVLIVVFGNVRLAAKEGVTINYKEAMSGRSDLDADVEISSFYNFDGEDIGLSIWKPQNTDGPAPVVVFIHGGGWASGDRFMTYVTSHCRYFADHGYMAVSVDYPLSTDVNGILILGQLAS